MAEYIDLGFDVSKQTLTRTDDETVTAGSWEIYRVVFTFDVTWADTYKYARFESDAADPIDVMLTEGNDGSAACVIPWEVINPPSFKITVWGSYEADTLLTTQTQTVNVYMGADRSTALEQHPTPRLIDTYNTLAGEDLTNVATKTDLATAVVDMKAAAVEVEERLDEIVSSGSKGIRVSGYTTPQSGDPRNTLITRAFNITFPKTFDAAPFVIVHANRLSGDGRFICATPTNVTHMGFQLQVTWVEVTNVPSNFAYEYLAFATPSSNVPNEIIDARVDAVGFVHDTLGGSINATYASLQDALDDLDERVTRLEED